MPRFVVHRHVNVTYRWFVAAKDEDEARAKAEELYEDHGDMDEWDRETTDVAVQQIESQTEKTP